MLKFLVLFIILLLVFFLIKKTVLKQRPSDTPAGAIVMACGIFINGALKNIPFLNKNAGELFTIALLIIWIFIIASYAESVIHGKIKERHLSNPVKSFTIGTWIAGTSVCGIAVFQRLSMLALFTKLLFFLNLMLWLFYIGICIDSYQRIFEKKILNKVHGALLLSTVSTQSLVVFGNTIFGKAFPAIISQLLIILGVILYFFAFFLIMKRYFWRGSWDIKEDWLNTNCILHGAMSITGLASAVSKAVSPSLVLAIWIWVLIWFAIVEIIELHRAFRRVSAYGFNKGIMVYDVTQWSRIFTFGMLYTFTMKLNPVLKVFSNTFLVSLQNAILTWGTYVMVIILVIEGILFFKPETKASS